MKVLVAQSCLIICNPIDCRLPGSSVPGIFQAKIVEWVAIPFSRGSSRPRDWTWVSRIAGRSFTVWVTRRISFVEAMHELCSWQHRHFMSLLNSNGVTGRELLDQVIFPIWITKSGSGGGGGAYRPTSEERLQKTFWYNRKEHKENKSKF